MARYRNGLFVVAVVAMGLLFLLAPVRDVAATLIAGLDYKEVDSYPLPWLEPTIRTSTTPTITSTRSTYEFDLPAASSVPSGYTLNDDAIVTDLADETIIIASWKHATTNDGITLAVFKDAVTFDWYTGVDSSEAITISGVSASRVNGAWSGNTWDDSDIVTIEWVQGDDSYHLTGSTGQESDLEEMVASMPHFK